MGFFETFVALRFLRGVRRQKGFISLSTLISTLGVAVGVMTLIVVIGVMTGYTREMTKKILGVNAHVVLLKHGAALGNPEQVAAQVRAVPEVVAAHPFIYSQVMLSVQGQVSGAVLRGIDPTTLREGGPPALTVKQGRFADLAQEVPEETPAVAIGAEMAKKLDMSVGSYLTIISPLGSRTVMGWTPKSKNFRVAVIFAAGMHEFDSSLVLMGIPSLQAFLGLGDQVTGLEVEVKEIYAADRVARAIETKLGSAYFARDWMRIHRSLFASLKLQKVVLFIILTLIVMVAAFGIASTLFMMVMRKTKEIAILKSMGATSGSIIRIFLMDGLAIGVIGTVSGMILGLGLCALLKRYEFISLPKEIYYLATLPVDVQAGDVGAIIAAALGITLAATFYPSWQAARLDPVEAIRAE